MPRSTQPKRAYEHKLLGVKMQLKIYSTAISMISKAHELRYQMKHRAQAHKALNQIELEKGKTKASSIRLSKEYAKEVLGSKWYAPWLCVYSAVAGNFKEGWIPDNYYGLVVLPAIGEDYGNVSGLKVLTNKIFHNPVFPDIVYHLNNMFLSKNYERLGLEELHERLFENSTRIVFKPDNSFQGKGLLFFDKETLSVKKLDGLGNGVFQNYIDQHHFFDELMPNSVATVRITTYLADNGIPSLRGSHLRIGRRQDSHVKSATQIRIPINQEDGELFATGYLPTWRTIERHPDTGVTFAKRKIPRFDRCVSTALAMHNSAPFQRCIGWDMIVDKNDKVTLMEWNGGHNDIKFGEATQGPLFADVGWEKLWREGF